jgi:hypothetical protein
MLDYKELGVFVAALVAFIIFYKRFLHRDGDKPHKPAVIIISVLILLGIFKSNRPFLDKHAGDIFSIAVCILTMLVFTDLYDTFGDESQLKQIFRINTDGSITEE